MAPFGKRMYGSTGVAVAAAHMKGVTITVRKERFVSNEGAKDIPHKLAEAMAISTEWLDHALTLLTRDGFKDGHRVAKAYLMVYRQRAEEFALPKPTFIPGRGRAVPVRTPEQLAEQASAAAITQLREKLANIRIGLGKSQVIKVNDRGTGTKDEQGRDKHYLGFVKGVTRASNTEWGHIEVGYRAFREKACLPRILIHEGAHKYTSANDGPETGGYWNSAFADYLKPAAMTFGRCMINADSHALFVWALNVGREGVPAISDAFETAMASRWANGA